MKTCKMFIVSLFVVFLFAVTGKAQMTIHHINVGQGDATLLEFKRAAVLIDAGGPETAGDRYRYRDHLINYLDKFFERRTDLQRTLYSFIITHPHIDHTRFAMDVFNNFRVRNFVDNGDKGSSIGQRPVNDVHAYIEQQNSERPGWIVYNRIDEDDITDSGYQTQWLRTLQTSQSRAEIRFLNASKDCKDENNDSLVVLIRYRNTKMLIAGDAEWENDSLCEAAIPRMLARYGNGNLMDIDVYKAGHHGSHNGTNEDYLKEMSPKISILSTGLNTDRNFDNTAFTAYHYGHPRKKAVDEIIQWTSNSRPQKQAYSLDRVTGSPLTFNLTKAVYCTCWDGDITIPTNSAGNLLPVQTSN